MMGAATTIPVVAARLGFVPLPLDVQTTTVVVPLAPLWLDAVERLTP